MSRQDPGAANGGPIHEPGRCACRHLQPLHKPGPTGLGTCSASNCGCRRYQPEVTDAE